MSLYRGSKYELERLTSNIHDDTSSPILSKRSTSPQHVGSPNRTSSSYERIFSPFSAATNGSRSSSNAYSFLSGSAVNTDKSPQSLNSEPTSASKQLYKSSSYSHYNTTSANGTPTPSRSNQTPEEIRRLESSMSNNNGGGSAAASAYSRYKTADEVASN